MKVEPTNIWLLDPNTEKWGLMQPVLTPDAFEGKTSNLNEEGLYSTKIFGRQGTRDRDKTESYIDVRLPIFTPKYFKDMISLKSIYLGIIKGKEYAIWDDTQKDFIKSNIIEGDTGFAFFMSHYGELEPKETDSFKRKKKIKLFKEKRDIALSSKIIVLPAGLRDIDFLPDGGVSEHELNDYYRKLIFRSRSLQSDKIDETDPIYDNIRWGLQEAFNTIDDFIFNSTKGKGGFWQRKTIRRSVFGGTRNVIIAKKISFEDCDDDDVNNPNVTLIGVYQSLLAYAPVCVYSLTNGFLTNIFTPSIDMARLVDKKTFNSRYTKVAIETVEKWTTYDGLVKLFNGYGNPVLRNKPIIINDHYLSLTYDDGNQVMLLNDIDDLPEGLDKKLVHPTTYMELFYLECSPIIESKRLQVTRYPVEGLGSCIPTIPIIKPTNDGGGKRERINESGEVIGKYHFFPEYSKDQTYFDGMSVPLSRYSRMGADKLLSGQGESPESVTS